MFFARDDSEKNTKLQAGDRVIYEKRTGCFNVTRGAVPLFWNGDNKKYVPLHQIVDCLAVVEMLALAADLSGQIKLVDKTDERLVIELLA